MRRSTHLARCLSVVSAAIAGFVAISGLAEKPASARMTLVVAMIVPLLFSFRHLKHSSYASSRTYASRADAGRLSSGD